MALADQIRNRREQQGMTLDQLATKAGISKTYLWELERDLEGTKRPSAHLLRRVAEALSTTIAELLELPQVQVDHGSIEVPRSLVEFRERMRKSNVQVSEEELRDLATMRFRGQQPTRFDDWVALYFTLKRATELDRGAEDEE